MLERTPTDFLITLLFLDGNNVRSATYPDEIVPLIK
jgi:hypothetical protein